MKNKKEALKRQKAVEEILKLQEKILEYDPWIDEPWTTEELIILEQVDKQHQEWLDKQQIDKKPEEQK